MLITDCDEVRSIRFASSIRHCVRYCVKVVPMSREIIFDRCEVLSPRFFAASEMVMWLQRLRLI